MVDELLCQLERRVRDDPVIRQRSEWLGQKVAVSSEAVVIGIRRGDRAKVLSQRRCHMPAAAGRLKAREAADILNTKDVFHERPGSPWRGGKIVSAIDRLVPLSHHCVGDVLHLVVGPSWSLTSRCPCD